MNVTELPQSNADLELNEFATLKAIKGEQFQRDVYSSVIKFKDLKEFLKAFPNVQREVNRRKVASLKKYILTGLNKEMTLRFFSALTCTAKGTIYYDERQCRIAIDVRNNKLSINDGQHRTLAAIEAIDQLEKELKTSGGKKEEELTKKLEILQNTVIPIVIFDGLSEVEEMGLFHDLNNLAQRPSRNTNIRLNQTDLFSRMARELSDENSYLVHYGVERDKMSIQKSNTNTVLLATVYECIKEVFSSEYNYSMHFLKEHNYEEYKNKMNYTLNKLFEALPQDMNTKGKYVLEKSFALKSICKFISDARNPLRLNLPEDKVYAVISSMNWESTVEAWGEHNVGLGVNKSVLFKGGSYGAGRIIYNTLVDRATK